MRAVLFAGANGMAAPETWAGCAVAGAGSRVAEPKWRRFNRVTPFDLRFRVTFRRREFKRSIECL